jgi:hypothetical protein
MTQDQAAPCRHAGAPQPRVVANVATLIRELHMHPEILARHGLTPTEYADALPAAIETMRGAVSASNVENKAFLGGLLTAMLDRGLITELETPRYGNDTIFRLTVPDHGDVAIIQKGCPDGAHSSRTWETPAWATETYLWWLCSSMRYNPGTHVTKGVNRLQKRYFESSKKLDGIVFHNQLCGSPQRPCPKIGNSIVVNGERVPPPCIYVMPDQERDGDDWNWRGNRTRVFPGLLLTLFDIPEEHLPVYLGHVGFHKRGGSLRTTISSRFGPGQSTTYRS